MGIALHLAEAVSVYDTLVAFHHPDATGFHTYSVMM